MTQHDPAVAALVARIRRLSAPLQPRPTGTAPRLTPLPGIRAVLFDVYGTLFISASGDIGAAGEEEDERAFRTAAAEAGLALTWRDPPTRGAERLVRAIQASHARSRQQGIAYPEVDIVDIWQEVALSGSDAGAPPSREALRVAAVEYECRTNPVWPMPGAAELLHALRRRGCRLGIVSNAQFYTPLIFQALLGATPTDLGFEQDLCAWSYRQAEAKPATALFRPVLETLQARHGIRPGETLYVGNDRLKDIWPAAQLGCKTALFAGDGRSLRLRESDERCRAADPDVILDDLRQLRGVLTP